MNGWKGHHVGFCSLVVAVTLAGGRPARADYVFGTPVNMGQRINTAHTDASPSVAPNGLELYFFSTRPPSTGWDDCDLYVTRRASRADGWGEPVRLAAPLNHPGASDLCPWITQDGLALYFNSNRPGGYGGFDLWVARRPTLDSPWGEPVNVGPPVNSKYDEHHCTVFNDERELYFSDMDLVRPGGYGMVDVYVSTRVSQTDPWGEPQNLGPAINSVDWDQAPTYISPDGLSAYFTSYFRKGGPASGDIWIMTRPSLTAPWDAIELVGPPLNSINPDDWDSEVVFFPGGSMVYMESVRIGGFGEWDLWQARLIPVVDFNGDGKVDDADLVILIDNWGTSKTLCDIGPTPVGDGKVDIEDLRVFMTYYEKENPPAKP